MRVLCRHQSGVKFSAQPVHVPTTPKKQKQTQKQKRGAQRERSCVIVHRKWTDPISTQSQIRLSHISNVPRRSTYKDRSPVLERCIPVIFFPSSEDDGITKSLQRFVHFRDTFFFVYETHLSALLACMLVSCQLLSPRSRCGHLP